jgi:hypothetical protein
MVRSAREALVKKWEAELAHYQNADLRFATDAQKREFFSAAAKALEELKRPLSNAH